MGQGARLAAPGAGEDEQRPTHVLHGMALGLVQIEHKFAS